MFFIMDAQMLKSLELLDKFFAETPGEELNAMFDKYNRLSFESPIASQYLDEAIGTCLFREQGEQSGFFEEIKPDVSYASEWTQAEHTFPGNAAGCSNYALAA